MSRRLTLNVELELGRDAGNGIDQKVGSNRGYVFYHAAAYRQCPEPDRASFEKWLALEFASFFHSKIISVTRC